MSRVFRLLSQLLDVDLATTAPSDGDSLTYDSASSKWVPEAVSGGAGSDDQTAAEVPFTPAGTIAASDTQAAVEEVATDAAAALSTHSADTTSVHGITDTSALYRSGGTDVAVADGGTGASTAAGARANLDLEAGTDFPSLTTFNDHSARHENGGADEISVAGLSGTLADAQTPITHATSHQNGGTDEISVAGLSGALADAQTPTDHASSHQNGGTDEISVAGLSGELADPQPTNATKVDSGVSTDGQVLTSDGAGGAAWEDVPAGGAVAAEDVSVADTAGKFTATDVEGVLAELQDNIDAGGGGGTAVDDVSLIVHMEVFA